MKAKEDAEKKAVADQAEKDAENEEAEEVKAAEAEEERKQDETTAADEANDVLTGKKTLTNGHAAKVIDAAAQDDTVVVDMGDMANADET